MQWRIGESRAFWEHAEYYTRMEYVSNRELDGINRHYCDGDESMCEEKLKSQPDMKTAELGTASQ